MIFYQPRLPMVFQAEISECGLACLAMISAYYGKPMEMRSLRSLSGGAALGASVKNLTAIAGKLNLNARAYRLDTVDLGNLTVPAVLHWDMDHFVVLRKLARRKIIIHDPAVGIRCYRPAELGNHFTGIALQLEPDREFQKQRSPGRLPLSDLFSGTPGLFRRLGQILLLSLLIQILALLAPLYLQLVIDQGITRGDIDLVFMLALLFVALIVCRTGLNYSRGVLTLSCTNQLGFRMVGDTFRHLLRLPLAFFERREVGDIVSRFSSLESIKQIITQEMVTVIVDGIFSVLTLVLLFIYSPLLAALVLAATVVFTALRLATLTAEKEHRLETLVNNANQQSRFMENIRSMSTIKINRIEHDRETDWADKYTRYLNSGYELGKFQLALSSWQGLIFGLENIATIYLGALSVYSNQLTLGQFMSFLFLKQHFVSSMTALLPKLGEIKLMRLELDRVADIRLEPEESNPGLTGLLNQPLRGELQLKDLEFSYSGAGNPVISRLNLRIPENRITVITGPSGCGKTTLLKILLGLESADAGEILVDGRAGALSRFRDQVSAVLHGEGLLSGDLAFNINLGSEPYNETRLRKACERAGLSDLVALLPLGFATRIGELGSMLSAGQIKRVLLARAFYRLPRLLILDETLTHLGQGAAVEIMSTIRDIGLTAIIVSHDNQVIATADQTVRLPVRQQNTTTLTMEPAL